MERITKSRRGGELKKERRVMVVFAQTYTSPWLIFMSQCMTLQRVVSAHGPAAELVICRLESMQSHANSRQAGRQVVHAL